MPPALSLRSSGSLNSARLGGLLLLSLATAACQTAPPLASEPASARVEIVEDPTWKRAISDRDLERIEALDSIWDEALGGARRAGFVRAVNREGALLDPDSALPRPAPTPGSYMCRLLRFGSGEARTRAFTAYREHFCHIGTDGDLLSLTKQTGSDRPGGYLFEVGDSDHLVFLGSLALGEEDPMAYGDDQERDMAGRFERIGPFRFRLVVPAPRFGVLLEIMELTPAPVQNE